MSATGVAAKSKLLEIIGSQQRYEHEENEAKLRVAYLRDVHLCMLLQRISTQTSRTLLDIGSYVSDFGVVYISIRAQGLGEGWLGRAVFTSTITRRRLVLTSPVVRHDSECGVCCYELPSMLDEWDVVFSLVFDPKHRVDKYVGTPVEVPLGALHIDALDAIIPTSKLASSLNNGRISVVTPCLCEVWLCPTSPVTNDDLSLTTKLLHTLLFEAVTPQTRARTAAIMLDRHTAEFCIAEAAGSTGAVSVMCVLERDHLALRIQSATDWLAFAAVCYSLSKRLNLLLEDATSGNSTSDAGQPLLALQEKYAGVIVAADQGQASYDGACRWGRPQAVDFVDFTMVKGDLTLSLLE